MIKYEKGVEAFVRHDNDPLVLEKIAGLKKELGDRVLVLGHHYQQDDIVRFADHTGDSLVLSRKAAEARSGNIVFCGVEFMAECADILSRDDQAVYLPRQDAGCSMADMADRASVEMTWEKLTSQVKGKIIPVTYINSSADIKAFVGEKGGVVCTSANAPKIFDWARHEGDHILFLPDQFLGKNTALAYGIPESDILVLEDDNFDEDINTKQVFLWNGYCSVHKLFQLDYVQALREKYPQMQLIVHGECRDDLVREADFYGSTSVIINKVSEAEPGSVWGVGTEEHLVRRLRRLNPDKTILSLSDGGFQCATMSMVRPEDLLRVLEEIRDGKTDSTLAVPESVKPFAAMALKRMLEIS